jgi:hypothetical protein
MLYSTTRDVVVVVVAVERERGAARFLHSRRILNRRLIRSIERDDVFFAAVTRTARKTNTQKNKRKMNLPRGLYTPHIALFISHTNESRKWMMKSLLSDFLLFVLMLMLLLLLLQSAILGSSLTRPI